MGHRPGPGRKSKGDRDNFAVKPMRPVGDVIRANADQLGMTYGEYCAAISVEAMGMPKYAPTPSLAIPIEHRSCRSRPRKRDRTSTEVRTERSPTPHKSVWPLKRVQGFELLRGELYP